MQSKKYKKFLEEQAEKNPVKIEVSQGSDRFKISWESTKDRPPVNTSSDILDSIYLGRDMEESVVVDRRVAALLKDRLRGLEEENIRMYRRIRMLKLVIGALAVIIIVVSIVLISMRFPPARILP